MFYVFIDMQQITTSLVNSP